MSSPTRLERLAAIAFGHAPAEPTRAHPGWQRRLSSALGFGPGAGEHAALDLDASPTFDGRALAFATQLRERMQRDIVELEALEDAMRADLDAMQPLPLAATEEMDLAQA